MNYRVAHDSGGIVMVKKRKVYIYNYNSFIGYNNYYMRKFGDSPSMDELKSRIDTLCVDDSFINEFITYSVSAQYEDRCYQFRILDVTDDFVAVKFMGMIKG